MNTQFIYKLFAANKALHTLLGSLLLALLWGHPLLAADSLTPPSDPRQSITYWKQHTLSPDSDPRVKQTHEVFDVLLRSWDHSRLDPGLYVVNSNAGAWAASLADGSILLSRRAIDICMRYGEQRGAHLLAFVLAHELAHQRADDLWHQRFFRMVGQQSPQTQAHLLRGLNLDEQQLEQLEQKEAQADHDALILMSSVGYDPHQVLDKKDFFTEWVENIWQNSCADNLQAGKMGGQHKACQQAQARALRARLQLNTVASQSTLYELGVQAFVARDYPRSRHYFTLFGRDYPSRAVISALAMTYLAEAVEIKQQLIQQGYLKQADFYYPLMLDASVAASPARTQRGVDASEALNQQLQQRVEQGIKQLERAIELEPGHRRSYLLLATAYLLSSNTYMVRGVIQGRYIPRFASDASSQLILAMTESIEGKSRQARRAFKTLLSTLNQPLKSDTPSAALPSNLLAYSAFYNSAAHDHYRGEPANARHSWQQLARLSRKSGNSLLFRLSLGQIQAPDVIQAQQRRLSSTPGIQGLKLGDAFPGRRSQAQHELWIEGERFRVMVQDGGHFVVSDKGRIISAWQEQQGSIEDLISIGDLPDRPMKALGVPDRHLHMLSGEYLAYDRYGLALHINQNKIQGWFLY